MSAVRDKPDIGSMSACELLLNWLAIVLNGFAVLRVTLRILRVFVNKPRSPREVTVGYLLNAKCIEF